MMMCKSEGMGGMCVGHKVAAILLVVGGLNWGLVALNPDWNLVAMIFGAGSMGARIVYGLVGVSALMMLGLKKCGCMKCGSDGCGSCKGGGSCKGEGSCKGGMTK